MARRKFSPCLIIAMVLSTAPMAEAQQMHQLNVSISQPALLIANAGNDITSTDEVEITIGGQPAATGGTAPYVYSWSPQENLSDHTLANPILDLIEANGSYTLTVTDSKGCSDTDELSVLVTIVSVERDHNAFKVYPNPVSDAIIVESELKGSTVKLVNLAGVTVKQWNHSGSSHELSVSDVSAGFYLLKIQHGRKLKSVKLLIRR